MKISMFINGTPWPEPQIDDVLEGDVYLDQTPDGWFEEGYRDEN